MIGYARITHRSKKDCIKRAQLFQPVLWHHPPCLEIGLATPVEMLPRQRKIKTARCRLEHANSFGDHFAPDAVAFNHCNFVILQVSSSRPNFALTLARSYIPVRPSSRTSLALIL